MIFTTNPNAINPPELNTDKSPRCLECGDAIVGGERVLMLANYRYICSRCINETMKTYEPEEHDWRWDDDYESWW